MSARVCTYHKADDSVGVEMEELFLFKLLTVSLVSLLSHRLSLALLCSCGTTHPTPVAD